MQIPILNGAYTDADISVRTLYPTNLIPVIEQSGVSDSFLRPADGIVQNGTGPGVDRGGVVWNDRAYRVMGSKFVEIDESGNVTTIGDVGNDGKFVSMDYSFDLLGIASNGNLFYYDLTTLSQNVDPNLGTVLDVMWIDGFFMTTDGEFLVVTELNDPFSVNPLKYGSSEVDPDPILAVLKLRNEAYALNRYTIEIFNNIGGDFFPFQRVNGAQIPKGVIGTKACTIYMHEFVAFVGGGRNEQNSIYLAVNGIPSKIATKEIENLLETFTDDQLSLIKVESRNERAGEYLYIHLPDRTIVYDHISSKIFQQPVWFQLSSHVNGFARYEAQSFIYAYNKWLVGDPTSTNIGFLDATISSQWGNDVSWEFGTKIMYNGSIGMIVNELELVAITGRAALGKDPMISTSYSTDGLNWSQDKYISAGKIGDTTKRLRWFRQGYFRNWRVQRFRGDTSAPMSFLRLEATLEGLQR